MLVARSPTTSLVQLWTVFTMRMGYLRIRIGQTLGKIRTSSLANVPPKRKSSCLKNRNNDCFPWIAFPPKQSTRRFAKIKVITGHEEKHHGECADWISHSWNFASSSHALKRKRRKKNYLNTTKRTLNGSSYLYNSETRRAFSRFAEDTCFRDKGSIVISYIDVPSSRNKLWLPEFLCLSHTSTPYSGLQCVLYEETTFVLPRLRLRLGASFLVGHVAAHLQTAHSSTIKPHNAINPSR